MSNSSKPIMTQRFLDSIKPGDKQVDYQDAHQRGLALRVSPGGTATWVLIKRIPDVGVRRIRLGRYVRDAKAMDFKPSDGAFPHGTRPLSLAQARVEAAAVLAMLGQGLEPTRARARAEQQRQVDAERGSFADLLRDFVEWRRSGSDTRSPATDRQLREWGRFLAHLERTAPDVLANKARDVQPVDIVGILRPVFHGGVARPKTGRGSKGRRAPNGARGGADKLQTFLRAAFAYGLQSEHSVARKVTRTFGLVSNPVAAVPRETRSKAVTRALSAAELRQFYRTIDLAPRVSATMAGLLRLAVASGGQRVHQIAREPWGSFNVDAGHVSLIDRKGRGGIPRTHMVPMTARMRALLDDERQRNGGRQWPWATGDAGPIDISSPATAVRYWLESEHGVIDGKRIEPFTPRDLRRTCTRIMQAAGIPEEQADRLQSHGVAGVVGKHYRNDPTARLPEFRGTLAAFDAALSEIVDQG